MGSLHAPTGFPRLPRLGERTRARQQLWRPLAHARTSSRAERAAMAQTPHTACSCREGALMAIPNAEEKTVTSNLTRDEAAERARLLRVESYQVELDLTGGETTFGSVTTVRFSCLRPGTATFADLTAPEVSQIILNGSELPASAFDGDRIALQALAGSNELTVRAQCAYSRSGEGLHRFTDPADKAVYLYSDLETFDAHRIYACFDQPDLKATFEFTVLCPDTWQVISNMAP